MRHAPEALIEVNRQNTGCNDPPFVRSTCNAPKIIAVLLVLATQDCFVRCHASAATADRIVSVLYLLKFFSDFDQTSCGY